MTSQAESVLIAYLMQHGISDAKAQDEVKSGFDLTKPVYQQKLEIGDTLYQFMRLPTSTAFSPRRGRWYGLKGMTASNVAVLHGLSGRRLHAFRVKFPFIALEGTACTLPVNWEIEVGGPGGGTQLFVPNQFGGYIEPIGPVA